MTNQFTVKSNQGDTKLIRDALYIREQVFCNEQHIAKELDFDGKDTQAYQVVVYSSVSPVATGRIVLGEHQIARIAVLKSHRKLGLSHLVMDELEKIAELNGLSSVKLTPHIDLLYYYSKRGYQEVPDSRFDIAGHELTVMKKKL